TSKLAVHGAKQKTCDYPTLSNSFVLQPLSFAFSQADTALLRKHQYAYIFFAVGIEILSGIFDMIMLSKIPLGFFGKPMNTKIPLDIIF
ncbi:MAG: hypothetical protein J6Q41_00540, partial [Firmicutes bacterium]|nr:hypothetical protein [Bacillota bacterium]